jgi:hypothetical protein
LILISSYFYPYFIWNFWSKLGLPFDQISLNFFKLIQINAKLYYSPGLGPPPFLLGPAHTHPRVCALRPLTGRTHLSAAPSPGTVPLPTCQSPPPLFPVGNARATRAALGPLSGVASRAGPGPMTLPHAAWHSRGRTLPPSPSLFPSLPRRRPAVFKPRLKRRLLLHHQLLSSPPLERHTFPHRSPRPDHPPPATGSPPSLGFRPSAATVRHSPVSSSPSHQSLQFLAISSPPCPSRAAGPHRTRPRPPGAPSPPTNAAVPELSSRLTTAPPPGYAPPPPDLPGVTPEPHWCPRGEPLRRLAATAPWACAARAHRPQTRLDRAARPRPSQLVGQPRETGRQPPWAVTQSRFLARYYAGDLIVFLIVLNSRN